MSQPARLEFLCHPDVSAPIYLPVEYLYTSIPAINLGTTFLETLDSTAKHLLLAFFPPSISPLIVPYVSLIFLDPALAA